MRTFITAVSCFLIASVSLSGVLWAGTIYEYTDNDGSVVLTDTPPSGVKVKPVQKFRDMTEAEKQEFEKEKASAAQKYQEVDTKRKEKEEKIRVAREEYEQAVKNEQRYRANRNQSANYSQQRHWNKMLEEQNKELEEKKMKLQQLESEP